MKTMPRTTLKLMRFATEFMLTRIARWEDKYVDERHLDYQLDQVNNGLWQASQSMKAIIEGDFLPTEEEARLTEEWLPRAAVAGSWYAKELFSETPVPLHPVD